jgi:hypothetical protein
MAHQGRGPCLLDGTWSPRKDVAGGGLLDTDGIVRESHDSDGDLGSGNGSNARGDSTILQPGEADGLSSRSSGNPYPPASSRHPSFFVAFGELLARGSSNAVSPASAAFRAAVAFLV